PLKPQRQAVQEDPEAPAAPVGQKALQDRRRPSPPAARPRQALPLALGRSLLRKWKAQLQPRYFSHACAHLTCPFGVVADTVDRLTPAPQCVCAVYRHRSLPQSSSSSRFTAAQAGFFILSQSGERPER